MKSLISCIASIVFLFILNSCNSSKKVTTIDFHDGSYVGEVDGKGLKQGKGTYSWLDGSIYEGDFDKDLRHGSGRFTWSNGETYKGDYLQDQRTGLGIYTWPDGSYYEGSFLNGKRHGTGIFISSTGAKYDGEWFDDLRHGQGTLFDADGRIIRGIWQNGKLLTKPMDLPNPAPKPDISLDTSVVYPAKELASSSPDTTETALENDKAEISSNPPSSSIPSSVTGKMNRNETPPVSSDGSNSITIQSQETPTPVINPDSSTANNMQVEETALSPINDSVLEENGTWSGTVDEVENKFTTRLIDGIDTIFVMDSNEKFSGKMRILEISGEINGELELRDGRMHGEELYFENGELVEKNLWENGNFIRNLPLD
tara:strand:- start:314 stop:1426 length:1113 start_codon:yes stop_codon:yes gene_type:complete